MPRNPPSAPFSIIFSADHMSFLGLNLYSLSVYHEHSHPQIFAYHFEVTRQFSGDFVILMTLAAGHECDGLSEQHTNHKRFVIYELWADLACNMCLNWTEVSCAVATYPTFINIMSTGWKYTSISEHLPTEYYLLIKLHYIPINRFHLTVATFPVIYPLYSALLSHHRLPFDSSIPRDDK